MIFKERFLALIFEMAKGKKKAVEIKLISGRFHNNYGFIFFSDVTFLG